MVNHSTSKTPFEIVYTCPLRHVCDLVVMPTTVGESKVANNTTEKALKIHAEIRPHLEVANAKYKSEVDKHLHKKVFAEGDLVMAYLRQSYIS